MAKLEMSVSAFRASMPFAGRSIRPENGCAAMRLAETPDCRFGDIGIARACGPGIPS
jgi:hypothetical protein